MSVKANCPACGGPVVFNVGTSLVTVCPYCRSVVGRGDRGIESLGKVADLVETMSPLDVGLKGKFDRVGFDLTGRTQFQHPAGGVWDEWYAAFGDGRWGWLAEAQGRFYLTFEAPLPDNLPSYAELELGQKIPLGEDKFLVAEKNRAKLGSARGEIPYRVIPGEEFAFADLSGPQGKFATIDYGGEKPVLYLGRQVTLDELHIPPGKRKTYPGMEPKVQALSLNCPKCGAAMKLHAPDKSERVGCPSCGALSNVKGSCLELFKSLAPPSVQPAIPLGTIGKRHGIEWTVVGMMQRYVTFEGTDYFWEEYLLYQPRLGFAWLTRSDEHWNWVEPLPPGVVSLEENVAIYGGNWYRIFQRAKAKVSFVVGEFYWKVSMTETVYSEDYVHAPGMLSLESTKEGGEGEINWSYAQYMPREEVMSMFNLQQSLPAPSTIGPNQPFPDSALYSSSWKLMALALLVGIFFWFISPAQKVFEETFTFEALNNQQTKRLYSSEPMELSGMRNIRIVAKPNNDVPWLHIKGALVPATAAPEPGAQVRRPSPTTTRTFAFLARANEANHVYLSAVPPGKYDLQLDVSSANPLLSSKVEMSVVQGVAHPSPTMVVIALLAIGPIMLGLYQIWYESRRWADSNTL